MRSCRCCALASLALALALPAGSQAGHEQPRHPIVSTGGASHVRGTSAELDGRDRPARRRHHLLLPVRADRRLRLADAAGQSWPAARRDVDVGQTVTELQPGGLPLPAGGTSTSTGRAWSRARIAPSRPRVISRSSSQSKTIRHRSCSGARSPSAAPSLGRAAPNAAGRAAGQPRTPTSKPSRTSALPSSRAPPARSRFHVASLPTQHQFRVDHRSAARPSTAPW